MEVDGKTPGLLPPKRVRRVLEEANQHGVAASLLMTADGSLLGAAGFDTLSVGGARAAPRLEPHTLGAIAANAWGLYAAASGPAGAGAARTMLCELEREVAPGGMLLGVCSACESR